jgi:hypothetical protein
MREALDRPDAAEAVLRAFQNALTSGTGRRRRAA